MSERLSKAEYHDLVELFCQGSIHKVSVLLKRYDRKTLEVAMRKIAIGYPPAPDHFTAENSREVVRRVLFNRAERQIIAWWYECQADFNRPEWVEYIHKADRTRDWRRPSVAYLCRVLRCTEADLRAYVFSTYLKPKLVPLKCPVPEWQ